MEPYVSVCSFSPPVTLTAIQTRGFMTLLQRQRTRSYKTSSAVATGEREALEKRLPDLPLPAGIENIPQTVRSAKTDSKQNGLLKRVGSIFSLRKRPNLDLQLVYSTYNRSPSYDLNSLRSSRESEAEIRCPSGLGSAVSIISKCSMPPSPFYPPNGPPYDPMCSQSRLLKRAISTPNLLRSFSLRVKGKKNRRRGASVLADKRQPEANSTQRSVSASGSRLPEIVTSLILAQLSQSEIASCATASRTFASAARSALYSDIDTSSISLTMLEKLTSTLSSQSQLAELVTSFTCPEWPPFFVSAREQGTHHGIRQRDTRLTAMFTLALERMYNLTSLTLPSFDASFVAHHSSFGLKSITFLDYMMSETETKALFSWLDGQVNISTLRFPNLFDIENCIGTMKARIKNDFPQPAPDSCYLGFGTPSNVRTPSPYSTPMPSPSPSILMQNIPPLTSPTLLPNLTVLHATPSLVMSLCSHLESSPITRRPLRSVFLNINSTLYNGLRPASLMSTLSGISHLGLRFTSGVDRRSFEKVIGAAGASLGSSAEDDNDDPFIMVEKNGVQSTRRGLLALEISFQTPGEPGRDEVCGFFSMNSTYK